jgi:hypothetical protein
MTDEAMTVPTMTEGQGQWPTQQPRPEDHGRLITCFAFHSGAMTKDDELPVDSCSSNNFDRDSES